VQSCREFASVNGDQNKLSVMCENIYTANAEASKRTVDGVLLQIVELRKATISLFKSFSNEMLLKVGMSFRKVSVLVFGFVIFSHPIHTLNIMKERYFKTI
jgi:hypothetical protein